ncbi:MAG TPA: hypothetical protein PKW56_07505, partial [Clostridiales bacterium]|nr:hypothetical protein [Clostridiales bacterium]
PNWNEMVVRDTTGTDYIYENDVVNEQQILGKPIDKLHNLYYNNGRENKCSAYVRNNEPQGVYFLPYELNNEVGFSESEINLGKEFLLQASMIEQGMTREEALSFPDGFGGRYKILTDDPLVTGYQNGLHVKDGPDLYHHGEVADNPSQGYNNIYADYGYYAETGLAESNKEAAQKEMTSNIARRLTTYTKGIANSTSEGFKKVDQMFIPMETMFYQKQATQENNATMNELIGKYYNFDY